MPEPNTNKSDATEAVVVRTATPEDQGAVTALFDTEWAQRDESPPDPEASDVRALAEAFLGEDGASCFWVAEHPEAGLIGMVGVKGKPGTHRGDVRRLLVVSSWRQKGVGSMLVQEALKFCNDRGYVKVALRARVDQKAAIELFKRFGFVLDRERESDGRRVMEFYMDLYRAPDTEPG